MHSWSVVGSVFKKQAATEVISFTFVTWGTKLIAWAAIATLMNRNSSLNFISVSNLSQRCWDFNILSLLNFACPACCLHFETMGVSDSLLLSFLFLCLSIHLTRTLVGLYSSLLSFRILPPRWRGWSPHSSARTTLSGSSLAFRARWTADMTCTRPTRWRSTPWRPSRWALMDDLGH